MKIKVTADSTCDLSPELIARHEICLMPLRVHIGDKECRDGVDATPDMIYAHVSETGELPATAAINPAAPPPMTAISVLIVSRISCFKISRAFIEQTPFQI